MFTAPRPTLLPSLLFCLTAGLALAMGSLVLLAPWLDAARRQADGWSWLVAVFAQDVAVRRTATAAAAGLLVTAFVFFRPPTLWRRGGRQAQRAASNNVVGA
jgi:hypothetical protein